MGAPSMALVAIGAGVKRKRWNVAGATLVPTRGQGSPIGQAQGRSPLAIRVPKAFSAGRRSATLSIVAWAPAAARSLATR
jgi:hypothetical protein